MNEYIIFELDVWTSVGARLATIGIVAVIVSVVGVLVVWLLFKKTGKELGESLIIILSISLIGGIVGDLSGSSQESVAGQLVPAVLTLIGAFGVYVFGQKRDSKDIINVAILALYAKSFYFLRKRMHKETRQRHIYFLQR